MNNSRNNTADNLTVAEKKRQLYMRQKELLDIFLSKGAITEEQYRKSLGDLTEKMGYGEEGR